MNEQKIIEDSQIQSVDMLMKELDELKKISQERLDQIKYLHADFDNYRKKLQKEQNNIIMHANEELIRELIVILDDFENSIKLIEDEKSKEGMTLIYNKFLKILQDNGLNKIDALGKKMNPQYHEVLFKEKSDKEDGEVIEEIQKGYSLNSKVIRPTMVKISEKFKNEEKKLKIGEENKNIK